MASDPKKEEKKAVTNREIAELLRKVAAAYQILNENRFKIMAYDRAADSIEHLTSEIKDLWRDDKLSEIPGIGSSITRHLEELFRTGKVRHFEEVLAKLPVSVYPLLDVPGIGPKKAYKLVTYLKLGNDKTVIADLRTAARDHRIAEMEGFGEKSETDILNNIAIYERGQIKENRMVLPDADAMAKDIIRFLSETAKTERIDVLGSLRRRVSTIGDIDIAVATTDPEAVISRFLEYPRQKLIEKGPTGASVLLVNGRQVDLRVQSPELYGAMLQYFTGSKNHNIHLRSYALEKGLSLSEYGIKDVKTGKTASYASEEAFYKAVGMPWIPPEIREDQGEIESALRQAKGKKPGLPDLVEVADIRGDVHIHTSYDIQSSHDIGADPLAEILRKADGLGYEYIGISDHNPRISQHSDEDIIRIMKNRKSYYEQQYSTYNKSEQKIKRVQIFIMLEIDILTDGSLALPMKAFEYIDAAIVSVHSAFTQPAKEMTDRILKGLHAHPKVRVLGHPTGRLLTKRNSIEADWKTIFSVCRDKDIALEVNAYPERLDLPDSLIRDAVGNGNRLIINSDSHAADQMDLMQYGVYTARRGWAEKHDVLNTMEYNKFREWLIVDR